MGEVDLPIEECVGTILSTGYPETVYSVWLTSDGDVRLQEEGRFRDLKPGGDNGGR